MEIKVLPGASADAAVELWDRVGLTRPWNDAGDDVRRALAGPASTVLAGSADGALVATAMVGHDGHRGWVYYLAVAPEQQGHGHGRRMMAACESWLRECEVPKLNIMVRGDNSVARSFYERLGYGTDDVVVLSRRLDSQDR